MIHSMIVPLLTAWKPLAYIILYIGMVLEGEVVLFTASFLAHQGVFHPVELLVIAMVGVFSGDALWYWMGRTIATSSHRWARRITQADSPLDEHIVDRPLRAMIIAKFAYGFNRILLARLGTLGLERLRFILFDICSTLPWMIIVMIVGYGSGAVFVSAQRYLRYAEILLAIILVSLYLALHYAVRRRTKRWAAPSTNV